MRTQKNQDVAAKFGLSRPEPTNDNPIISYGFASPGRLKITRVYPKQVCEETLNLSHGPGVCRAISQYRHVPGIVHILALAVFSAEFDNYWFKRCLPKLETAKQDKSAPTRKETAAYFIKKFDDRFHIPANPEHVVRRILNGDDNDFPSLEI